MNESQFRSGRVQVGEIVQRPLLNCFTHCYVYNDDIKQAK